MTPNELSKKKDKSQLDIYRQNEMNLSDQKIQKQEKNISRNLKKIGLLASYGILTVSRIFFMIISVVMSSLTAS